MPNIEHAIQITAPSEAIYPLVATAKGLAAWWAEDVTTTPGGADLGFFRRTTIYSLKLTMEQPPTLAEWTCESGHEWQGTKVLFRLEARGGATQLRFTHGGWAADTEYYCNCNTTWGELMYRLKAAAEGKGRGPLFLTADLAY